MNTNHSSSPQARYSYPLNFPSNSPNSSPTAVPALPSPSSSFSYTPRGSNSAANAKRKQVKNACVNCQRACKKCDDQRPCSRCVKYGIEEGCINSQRKERKRKSSEEQEQQAPTTTFNSLTSRRLTSSQTANPTASNTLRLSTRAGIRPFPKELLQSLQLESDSLDYEANELNNNQQEEIAFISPQVTDEFKTLAKICSDLHTVLAQPPHAQLLQNNTNYLPPYQHAFQQQQQRPVHVQPTALNPYPFCFTQQIQQRQSSFTSMRSSSPPLIQRRSISPSQLLLKPSSPIFNPQLLPHHLQLQLESHLQQQQQQELDRRLKFVAASTHTSHIQRDMMNRTPPEYDDQDQTTPKHHCEHGCEH